MSPPAFYYCTIIGQVTDQNNNPQVGIDIEWDPFKNNHFKKVAETDTEGNFSTKIAPIPYNPSTQILRALDQLEHFTVSPGTTVTVNFIV